MGVARIGPYPGPVRPTLPPAALLAVWGTAALQGRTSLDDAIEHAAAGGPPLRVAGVPGEAHAVGLSLALGRLRSCGATGLRLVLPRPGDPLGLPAPASFRSDAVEAGAALVAIAAHGVPGPALGLLPGVRNAWHAHPVTVSATSDLPSLAEADRALAESLRHSVEELVRLDVARWRPEVAAALAGLRDGAGPEALLPPGLSNRAHRVLTTALRIGVIVTLAGEHPGAAVTAREMAARTAALAPLERASRHALMASCNAALEPQPEGADADASLRSTAARLRSARLERGRPERAHPDTQRPEPRRPERTERSWRR